MFVVASKVPVTEMKEWLDPGGFEATHGAAPYQGDDCAPPDGLLVWGHRTLGDRRDPEIPDALHFVLRDAGLVNNSSKYVCTLFTIKDHCVFTSYFSCGLSFDLRLLFCRQINALSFTYKNTRKY